MHVNSHADTYLHTFIPYKATGDCGAVGAESPGAGDKGEAER